MQVFVPYPSPIDVAKCLDRRRLHKQVIECRQIMSAIEGETNAWANHPIVKMYADHWMWLSCYTLCLAYYMDGDEDSAQQANADAFLFRPSFLTRAFCNQHRRRLYTKSPSDYPQFSRYGESEENWYFVDGKVVRYLRGKKL